MALYSPRAAAHTGSVKPSRSDTSSSRGWLASNERMLHTPADKGTLRSIHSEEDVDVFDAFFFAASTSPESASKTTETTFRLMWFSFKKLWRTLIAIMTLQFIRLFPSLPTQNSSLVI